MKRIKIYTHKNHYLNVGVDRIKYTSKFWNKFLIAIFSFFYYAGLGVIKFFKLLFNFVASLSFHTGKILVNSALSGFKAAAKEITNTKESLPKRLRKLTQIHFAKSLLSFLVIAGLAVVGLSSLKLVAKALDIKNKILHTTLIGNYYLNQAKDSLSSQDLSNAQDSFSKGYKTFTQGQEEIRQSGELVNNLLGLLPQKQDADRLLQAARLISQAGQNFVEIAESVKSLKINQSGLASSKEVFETSLNLLKTAQAQIAEANLNVNQINPNSLPESNREQFLDLKTKLNQSFSALQNFSRLFELTGNLVMGDQSVLLLFENNNELRPSGGFPGTFGFLKLRDGNITSIKISSIYDLDGQLTEVIKPPSPLLNVSDRWFLRDAGWFADFPTSAKKLSSFYEKEGGETPDSVIIITPNLIVDLLKITGPINMPHYGLTLTSENFVEKTQAVTTISQGLPTNSPKQLLADLVPLLLQRLGSLKQDSWGQIVQALQINLDGKQIVIYSRNSEAQNKLQGFGWAGEILDPDRDFLSVVSANLGGTKTDLDMEQKTSLTTNIANDGTITNQLSITRTNKMPKLGSSENLSFIRVLVPEGSKLISNLGFDFKHLGYPENTNYKTDAEALAWEKNSVTDNLTGTVIGQESGKTFFGNWLNVDGGETRTVSLTYQLPFKLNDVDRYSLLLQKQLGTQASNFNWTLNFPNRQIAWKNFEAGALETSSLNSDINLGKDYFFGLVLDKR